VTRDNLTMRWRLVVLVLGSLLFIAGVMGPFAITMSNAKNAEFRRRLESIGGASMEVYDRQMQATADASAAMGIAATALLAFTLACGLYAAGGIVRRLRELTESAERMRRGDLETPVPIEAETELDDLAVALDRMRFDLKQVVALSVQRTDLDKDIAVASTVQTFFLPRKERLEAKAMTLEAFYRPASRCGGDWWWVRELDADNVLVLVADVTGHGTGPAMITASLTSAFHVLFEEGRGHDPAGLLAEVNDILREACREQFFVTLGALKLNTATGFVQLWNAGAPPVLIMTPSGAVEAMASAGNRLGEQELKLGYSELTLEPGSRILAFTDGIPELAQADGKTLGMRRLRKALQETRGETAHEARERLESLVNTTSQGVALEDDMTFVLVDFAMSTESRAA